jgi:hypothetical protein
MSQPLGTENLSWDCKVNGTEDLTVGTPFGLQCSGPEVPFSGNGFLIMSGNADPFQLRLLKIVNGGKNQIEAVATSYRPGDASKQTFFLTDGKEKVELKNISFTVKSVIQSKQEPFPKQPPWVMSFPMWFWLMIVAFCLLSFAGVLWRLHALKERKRLMKEAKSYKTNRPAIDEYYKELRQLERRTEKEQLSLPIQTAEFEKIFRNYLTRQFEVPAHVWSLAKVWSEIQGGHIKLLKKEGPKLNNAMTEVAKVKSIALSEKDLQQLIQMVSKVIEAIQKFEKQNQRSEA